MKKTLIMSISGLILILLVIASIRFFCYKVESLVFEFDYKIYSKCICFDKSNDTLYINYINSGFDSYALLSSYKKYDYKCDTNKDYCFDNLSEIYYELNDSSLIIITNSKVKAPIRLNYRIKIQSVDDYYNNLKVEQSKFKLINMYKEYCDSLNLNP